MWAAWSKATSAAPCRALPPRPTRATCSCWPPCSASPTRWAARWPSWPLPGCCTRASTSLPCPAPPAWTTCTKTCAAGRWRWTRPRCRHWMRSSAPKPLWATATRCRASARWTPKSTPSSTSNTPCAPSMNLQQIETFVRVAEAGSFSKAAVLLDMAQPALSRQVRALETELRETLLIRTGRGVQPTDAGRRLLEHGHAILQRVALAKADLGALRDEPVGRITVGLPPSMARCLTLPLIEAFARTMPKARLALVEGFSVNIAEWLATGRIDLGLAYTPEPHPLMEIAPVLQEDLCLIGPAAQLLGRGASVPFAQLAAFPLIMPQRGQIFRKLMEAQAALSQVKLDVVWEVSSVPAILDLVRCGRGFAALTGSAMRGDAGGFLQQPELVSVPISSPHIVSTLCLVQPAKKKSTPLVRRTAELLRTLSLQVCTQPLPLGRVGRMQPSSEGQ